MPAEFPATELNNATQRMLGFLYQGTGQLTSCALVPFHLHEAAARGSSH